MFSWVINADGTDIKKFNNASIAFAVDGAGVSGIVSVGLSFSIPVSAYPNYDNIFEGGKQVSVHGYNSTGGQSFQSQTFYVSSKSSDGDTVSVKCYDRMTYAEADFPCTEEEFYDDDGNETGMSANLVMSRITSEMGLSPQLNDNAPFDVFSRDDDAPKTVPKSLIFGKTCRDILNTFAAAFCGVWCCCGTRLIFAPFGWDIRGIAEIQASAGYHEKVKKTSRILFDSCRMTDNTNSYGESSTGSGTVNINTPLACPELYSAVVGRVKMLYQGYSCGNAYIDALPAFPMSCTFSDGSGTQPVNYCSVKLTKKGALASLGMNRIDEGEWVYKNRTRRELDSRYKDGELWGNTEITKKDGIKHVYVNENGSKEKHGYETCGEGVTLYDGDMIDKIPAGEITPEYDENDNMKTVTYTKDGVKTVIKIEWDGDVIKSYKRKKIKVDPETGAETVVFADDQNDLPD